MQPKVIPLARIDVDWTTLLGVANQALNKNLTTDLDRKGKKIGNSGSYIEILGAMKDKFTLNNPGPILKQLFFSFIVISDNLDYLEDLQLNNYTVSCQNGLYLTILSGTLDSWQTAIINGCSEIANSRTRFILDQCLFNFDNEGLGNLWLNYRRVKSADQTIKLIAK
jgi:hypothetical protein